MGFVEALRRIVRDEPNADVHGEYPAVMNATGDHAPFGFPLPEGIVYQGPARLPDETTRRRALEGLVYTSVPPSVEGVDEAIACMERASGSIVIGRPPRRSDYRGRGKWS